MQRMLTHELTYVSTTSVEPLGAVYTVEDPTYGEQTWIYVKNDEAATAFAIGTGIARKAAALTRLCIVSPTSCPLARLVGVAQHAIAAQSYGWVLREGGGLVLADTGGLSADTSIIPGNAVAGRFDDAAATAANVGLSLAATAATATGAAYVSCRG
jgi:hypothetical protein